MSTSVELIEVEFIPLRSEFFKYIIYVPRNELNNIIVENCETQKIAQSSVSELNQYIQTLKPNIIHNIIYRRIDSVDVLSIEMEREDNHNASKWNVIDANSFMFVDFPQYVTIMFSYPDLQQLEDIDKIKIPSTQNFYIKNNIIYCKVPYLATFVWYSKSQKFYKLMFYYNGEFYRFPYGNVSVSGHICCQYIKESSIKKFFTGFNSSLFNADYNLSIKGSTTMLSYLVEFNKEKIISKIESDENINILNIFYVLSEMSIDEVPWDKWFYKAPLSWFNGRQKIKNECINLAKSILGE